MKKLGGREKGRGLGERRKRHKVSTGLGGLEVTSSSLDLPRKN